MSELLSMMMSGGKKKTLNLVTVGGATYDENYIFNSSNNSKYFETVNNVVYNESDIVEIKIKIKISSTSSGFFTNENYGGKISFAQRTSSTYNMALTVNGSLNTVGKWNSSIIDNWNIYDFYKNENSIIAKRYDENYNLLSSVTLSSINTFSLNEKIRFGLGILATNTIPDTLRDGGAIDFKETDIIINGTSILWV